MKSLCRNLRIVFIYGTVSMLLFLSACITLTATPPAAQLSLVTPAQPCEACVQATLAVALTQQVNTDNQAAAAAEIVHANAQATLNSAGSTQSAALTADVIAPRRARPFVALVRIYRTRAAACPLI